MRYYSSNALETSLVSSVTSSGTTFQVEGLPGYPTQTPFAIRLEKGTSNEEICLVTAVNGSTLTVQRGFDGSSQLPHETGARIVHDPVAVDFSDNQTHINSATGVHGLGPNSEVVGTTSSQTLVGKTFTSPVVNTPDVSGGSFTNSVLTTPTVVNWSNAQHTHVDAQSGGTIPPLSLFPKNSGNPNTYISNSSYTIIPSTSITFTAPSAWPTNASRIVWYFTCQHLSNNLTGDYFNIQQRLNGTPNPYHTDMIVVTSQFSLFRQYRVFTDLPAVGVSHTSSWYTKNGSVAGGFGPLFVWAQLI